MLIAANNVANKDRNISLQQTKIESSLYLRKIFVVHFFNHMHNNKDILNNLAEKGAFV